MQDFRLQVNNIDSLLNEATGLNYDIKLSGKHNQEVEFVSKTSEGIDVILKLNKSDVNKVGALSWKYCADPTSDYWVRRNSNDIVSMTQDFHNIIKNKMFDPEYLKAISKIKD
jgi:hypothetical protein